MIESTMGHWSVGDCVLESRGPMTGKQSSSLLRTEVGFVGRLALLLMLFMIWLWVGASLLRRLFELSRLAVVVVFTIVVLPVNSSSINARVAERETEVLAQNAEENEDRRAGLDAHTPRRLRSAAPPTRELEALRAPQTLAPRRNEVPRPSWERPRRSIPPDEDDELLARARVQCHGAA